MGPARREPVLICCCTRGSDSPVRVAQHQLGVAAGRRRRPASRRDDSQPPSGCAPAGLDAGIALALGVTAEVALPGCRADRRSPRVWQETPVGMHHHEHTVRPAGRAGCRTSRTRRAAPLPSAEPRCTARASLSVAHGCVTPPKSRKMTRMSGSSIQARLRARRRCPCVNTNRRDCRPDERAFPDPGARGVRRYLPQPARQRAPVLPRWPRWRRATNCAKTCLCHDRARPHDVSLARTSPRTSAAPLPRRLRADGAGLADAEAVWVVRRLAELLDWPQPGSAGRRMMAK